MKKTILGFFCGLAAGFYGAVSIIESHYISAAVVFILFAGFSIAYAKAHTKRR